MSELDSQSLYIYRKHAELPHIYGEAPAAVLAAEKYFKIQLQAAINELKNTGCYLLGSTFTAVDILLGTVLMWAKRIGWLNVEDDSKSIIDKYLDLLQSRPAYIKVYNPSD